MKSTADSPLRRNVIISNELGLHARAAARIAKLADKARSKVFIMKGGREADGTDIIDVVTGLTVSARSKRSMECIDHKGSDAVRPMGAACGGRVRFYFYFWLR